MNVNKPVKSTACWMAIKPAIQNQATKNDENGENNELNFEETLAKVIRLQINTNKKYGNFSSSNNRHFKYWIFNQAKTPLECFKVFIDNHVIAKIVEYTNAHIYSLPLADPLQQEYSKPTNAVEVQAFLGVILSLGSLNYMDTDYELLWNSEIGREWDVCKASMSYERNLFLKENLRLNDTKATFQSGQLDESSNSLRELFAYVFQKFQLLYGTGDLLNDKTCFNFEGSVVELKYLCRLLKASVSAAFALYSKNCIPSYTDSEFQSNVSQQLLLDNYKVRALNVHLTLEERNKSAMAACYRIIQYSKDVNQIQKPKQKLASFFWKSPKSTQRKRNANPIQVPKSGYCHKCLEKGVKKRTKQLCKINHHQKFTCAYHLKEICQSSAFFQL